MGRSLIVQNSATVTSAPAIGGIAANTIMRSGAYYRNGTDILLRADYPELSAAFPRCGMTTSRSGTMQFTDTVNSCGAVAFGNGIHVALQVKVTGTCNGVSVSRDKGETFERFTLPSMERWSAITFGNGLFLVVAGAADAKSTVAATSPDGINWTPRVLPTLAAWAGVAFGGGMFVAVAGGNALAGTTEATTIAASSPDGINWTARVLPTNSKWGTVSFANGTFVALSDGTAAARSINGTVWTAGVLPGAAANWRWLAYGAGLWVATNSTNDYATSPDGTTWTARNLNLGSGSLKTDVVMYGNGVFFIPEVGVSLDGIYWTKKASGSTGNNGVYADGLFLIVRGTVATPNSSTTILFGENYTDSEYIYLTAASGWFVRIK